VQTISPTSSLFVVQRSFTYSKRNMEKFLGRLWLGWEKVACWGTKAGISLKRVKIEEKLPWRASRKSPTLFQFFWVAAIFLLPVSPLRPPRRPFLPYFCPYSPEIGTRLQLHQAQLTLTISEVSELSIIVMATATHVPHQPTAVA